MMQPLRLFSAALPSALVLAACTPVTRTFGNTGGGATTTTTATTSTTTGTGGGGPAGKCDVAGAPFVILSPQDLAGLTLDDKPFVVADPGSGHPMVHVVLNSKTDGSVIVRSLSSDPTNTVVNKATYGGQGQGFSFTPVSGWAGAQQLLVQGSGGPNGGIGQVVFQVDSQKGVLGTPAPTQSSYQTPPECLPPNHPGRVLVVQNGGTDVHYVAACELSNNTASVWFGSGTAPPVKEGGGGSSDLATNPNVYGYVNGTNFVGFSPQGGIGGAFAYGPDGPLPTPAGLTIVPGEIGVLLATAPLTDDASNDGLAVFAASVTSDMSKGSLWSGAVHLADFPTLATSPATLLKPFLKTTAVSGVAAFQRVTTDAAGVYAAGATFTANAVHFGWFTRDGTPLVIEDEVYKTSTTTVLGAAAAPLGLPTVVVVWVEKDGANPPNFTVSGQKLICVTSG